MRNLAFTFLLLTLVAGQSRGQSSAGYEPILLPVSLAQPVPGAFGSLWATDFRITAVDEVRIATTEQCGACPTQVLLFANGTLNNAFGNFLGETPGELIWLSRADAANARFNLRIRDLSREAQTWGTEIPIVRESQYRSNAITLLNVPLDARFRVALRAYDPDVHQDAAFRFDFLDSNTGAVLASRTVAALYKESGHFGFPRVAPCAQIGDVRAGVPEIANVSTVRVEISRANGASRFWAFASVTNDETQHVTLITPQQQP